MFKLFSFISVLLLLTVLNCQEAKQEQAANTFGLQQLWETPESLKVSESIVFDEKNDILYVSCINGKPTEKNGLGFIAKVNLDGKIETLKWIDGINAPKGSAIHNNTLYVSDIDRLLEIDIAAGEISNTYPAEAAIFLNDVRVDKDGYVYISDMSKENSGIYRLADGKLEVWLEGEAISSPNGLFIKDNRLFFGNSGDGKIKAVNIADKTIEVIAEIGHGIDGLVMDGQGNFIISDWSGKTELVTEENKIIELLNTSDKNINSADLEYIPAKNMLIIPTFFDNRIVAYRLNKMQ